MSYAVTRPEHTTFLSPPIEIERPAVDIGISPQLEGELAVRGLYLIGNQRALAEGARRAKVTSPLVVQLHTNGARRHQEAPTLSYPMPGMPGQPDVILRIHPDQIGQATSQRTDHSLNIDLWRGVLVAKKLQSATPSTLRTLQERNREGQLVKRSGTSAAILVGGMSIFAVLMGRTNVEPSHAMEAMTAVTAGLESRYWWKQWRQGKRTLEEYLGQTVNRKAERLARRHPVLESAELQ